MAFHHFNANHSLHVEVSEIEFANELVKILEPKGWDPFWSERRKAITLHKDGSQLIWNGRLFGVLAPELFPEVETALRFLKCAELFGPLEDRGPVSTELEAKATESRTLQRRVQYLRKLQVC